MIVRIFLVFCVLFGFVSCLEEEGLLLKQVVQSRKEMNRFIFQTLNETEKFSWDDVSDAQIASAFSLSNKIITVAWDYETGSSKDRDAIIKFIYESEGKLSKTSEDRILEINNDLRYLNAQIDSEETLLALRHMKEVVSVDIYYEIFTEEELESFYSSNQARRSTGEARVFSNYVLKPTDPVVAENHNITSAWSAGITGKGIKVAVVDIGPVKNDPYFGQNGSRPTEKLGFYNIFWWLPGDGVYSNSDIGLGSHASNQLKNIGNPKGEATGYAFDADLLSVRASKDVFIISFSKAVGVAKSFEYLANRSDVKIVSMSMGGLIDYKIIERAVKKCYSSGKMILAAGGSIPFVGTILNTFLAKKDVSKFTVFPARMDEVIVTTGITNAQNGLNEAKYCEICFGKADFAINFGNDFFVGSTSISTSMTSALVALIWSSNPSLSRGEVLEKMKLASDRNENKHPRFGHGEIDMEKFVENEGFNISTFEVNRN